MDHARGKPQAIDIAGAALIHVKRRAGLRQAEALLQNARRGGQVIIGRLADKDKGVHLVTA